MGVYFFYGKEDFLIDAELKKFRDKLDTSFSSMNYRCITEITLESSYGKTSFPDLMSILRTPPMMFGKLMIVIDSLELFHLSLSDSQMKEFASSLELVNDMLDVFFVARYPKDEKVKKPKKPDERGKVFKLLSKYNKQKFDEIPTYKTDILAGYIKRMADERKLKVPSDTVQAIINSFGNNIRQYEVELDKLAVYAYPNKTITKEMVSDICVSSEDLFNLTDYIMASNKDMALVELKKLLYSKHPLEILIPLQTMLKTWIVLKLGVKKMTQAELAAKIKIHPFRVQKMLESLKGISTRELVVLRKNLTEAEYRIKSGKAYDEEEELENAIIR